ncbi:KR domain-containing protein [Diaporthe sp. PMI_573]|nr:KR domain-containing protein [Diaporthaceae sp. PMI_573]
MGRELLRHSTFRRSMEQASQQVARLGCPWDLLEELRRGGDESRINEPTISQPACTAIQLALVDLLAEYGISPCAVVGPLQRPPGAAGGAMLAVGASPEAIQESIQKLGTEHGRMGVACFNSPRSLTVSGDAASIDAFKADLDQAGTFNRKLKTNGAAYHSHHMEAVADQYIKCLAGLATDPAQDRARSTCRFFSSNLLSPVLFTQAVTQMDRHEYQGGHVDVVMELGPHSQLGGPVKQIFQDMGGKQRPPIEYMSSLVRGKDGELSLLESLAQLHIRGGLSLPLHRLGHYDPVRTPKQLVDLPLYPFDHEKTFWHNTRVNKNYAHRKYPPHELLGTLSPEANKLEPRWRQFLSLKRLSWLKGHVVQRQLIFPAAGYLTMALQALHQHRRAQDPAVRIESMLLRNVSIVKALLLNEDGPDVEIALSLRPQPKCASASSSHWDEFRIFSVTGEDERWTEHCRGLIGVGNELNGGGLGGKEWWTAEEEGELELQEARCSRQVKSSQFYTLSQRLGFHWQHPFDSLSGLRTAAGACVATATAAPPDTGTTGTGGGLGNIWPVGLLDSCMFQGFFASLAFDGGVTSPTVPTFITEMRVSTNKPMAAGRTVRSTSVASTENPYAYDVAIRDDNGGGEPLIVARGINFIRLPDEAANLGGESGNVCYNVDWVPYVSAWKVEGPRKICGRTSEPSHCIDQVAEYCRALGRQTPRLKALGIGAGMTAAARPILQAVNGGSGDGDRYLARFDVSGLSQEDFESVKEECGNPLADVLGFRDLEDFQQQQGLQDGASDDDGGEYDVVLVSGQEVDSVLAGARQVLKPGGKLLLLATTRSPPHFDLEKAGFQDPQLCFEDCPAADDGTMGVFIATRPWLAASPTSEVLRIDLVTHDACRLNDTSTIDKTLPEAQVSAHSLSGPTPESANMVVLLPEVAKYLCASPSQSSWQAFKNWVLRARTVLFVGTGYSTEADSSSSAIWTGLARCLRLEHPHIRFVTIQFSQQGGGDVSEKIAQWLPVLLQRTSAFDLNRPGHETENEFLERDSQLYVSRLFPHRENSEYIRSMHHQSPPVPTPFFDENRTTMAAELGVTGLLDSIRWKPTTTGTPVVVGPDEVRLELRAASINFKDVLIAAGQLPGITQMRNDCSGIVVEVGANMRGRFQLGDRVMALYSDSYTNYPVVHGDCCHVVPENLSFEEAASVPIVWATVYYSLVDMGRLAKGDKILIHSAAGAVGQAAIMLAMDIGAEVFATVSSDDKVNLLVDQFGIPRDHIFSSRTGAFLSGIRRATGGRGVDVVLNSLSGEMFRHSCNVLAPFGRFVEIGRKELMDDALMPMAFMLKNITFAYVDMALIIDINKPLAQRVLGDVVRMLAADAGSSIRPVALTTFPISEIETAFRHIQAGKHTGKIILKVEDGQEVMALPRPPLPPTFQPNATYAVVGGFGGIGKASIEWLASHGAKEILCISRSGAKTQENQDFVKSMEDRGVRLTAVKCDVASKDEVASIARQFKEENRPIRGIIQSSVVFEDGLFEDMTVESWQNVMNPKVRGTANLHKHFQSSDIDFFVIMSSVVSMTGNDGQTNYAAACCFQDELMRQRTASGLHGFSINVGPVLEVGHLAEHAAVARQLRRRGFEPISIQQVLSMLSYAISHQPRVDDPDSSVCAVSYKPCPENGGDAQKRGLRFSHLIGDESSTGSQNNGGAQGGNEGNISDRLDEAPTLESAIEIICTAVLKQLGKLIATPAETLNLELSLDHYGVDSLIGVEMRNWLIAYLRTDLPLMTIRSTGSIKELAGLVAKESPMVGSY